MGLIIGLVVIIAILLVLIWLLKINKFFKLGITIVSVVALLLIVYENVSTYQNRINCENTIATVLDIS